jgi:hypothetical protein
MARPVGPVRPSGSGYRRAVVRWVCTSVTAFVLTGFTFLLLTGHYIEDGPVLVRLSPDHGIHQGDVFVVAGWVLAMLSLVVLTTLAGRREPAVESGRVSS